MTSPIPLDHFIFKSSTDLAAACQNFFNKSGISYFQYYRSYDDGSISAMLTNTQTMKKFIELDFPSFSSFKESDKYKPDYWFMWDEELPWLPVQIGRENGLYHGLTLIRRGESYYDMIGFAMSEERSNAASYYMTNMDMLNNFIASFEKDHVELIKESERSRILVPEVNRDPNYKKLCLDSNQRFIIEDSYITSREYSCLRLRNQGMSAKEIARILSISPRSVEAYFARIRDRTRRYNLDEIYREVILG